MRTPRACSTPNPGFPQAGRGRHSAGGGARSHRRRPTGRALTSSPAPSWPPALDGSGATGGLWSRSRADGPLATGLPYRPEVGSVVGWEWPFCATQLSMTTGHLTSFLAQVLIKCQEVMSIKKRQRCQRLAALEWSPEARAHRTEPLRGAGLTSRAQVCVARHTRAPVDGVPMALGALLGTGEERGRLEGKPGQGGHARRGEGHLGRVQTVSGQAGHATAHPVQARLGRERLPDTRPHAGQKKPRHENSHIVLVRGSFRINVDARPGQLTR